MVRAIVSETNAMVIDLSPDVVADKFPDRGSITKYFFMAFKVAKVFQPAIILIDEIEHYFPGKKKGGKKGKGGPVIGKCQKMKRDLMNQVNKHLTPDDKVCVIACTNRPYLANVKELAKFFYKKFYFPYPDYAGRSQIFHHLVEKKNAKLTENFP